MKKTIPVLRNFDPKNIVGHLTVDVTPVDEVLMANGLLRLEVGGIAKTMHMEGDVRVIDDFEMLEVSLVPVILSVEDKEERKDG